MTKKSIGLLFGPNGVGKGTLGRRLSKQFGYMHITTGELIRDWIREEKHPELKEIINAGHLLPDELMKEILDYEYPRLKLNSSRKDIIFDGFPRKKSQIRLFDKFCYYHDYDLKWIVVLEAPLEIILERLTGRVLAPDGNVYHLTHNPPPDHFTQEQLKQRLDDRPEVVERRYQEYIGKTKECLSDEYFQGIPTITIDATKSIDEVSKEADRFVNDYK